MIGGMCEAREARKNISAAPGKKPGRCQEADKAMDRDEVGRILAASLGKQRGYADFFDWPDKSVKEWGIARSFLEELERDNGPTIVSSKQHPGGPNHAPDIQVAIDTGEIWGVEITELVNQKAIEETKRGTQAFAVWPDDDLVTKFEALVAGKDRSEHVKGGPYDRYILLVHVDEDMLPAERLQELLGSRNFQTRLIDTIYVLVSHDPGKNRMPLLRFDTTKMPLDRTTSGSG